ncbi:FAD-dependent oxidoreductase [Rhizobium sp. S163]|uniref:GMC family oxidoreductase n=1 Tax=Rhizobium sp. S163 TaxID=3055039 RepID=UPI0025A964D9|nr:FAD-dependent oxidoreductase [Rhizobium sp. S163]MDM9648670.1 FAD-dependent oxidoreductase [Rhizobium sp. S163]
MVAIPISFDRARRRYDVIIVGSGASGSVIARRLSDDPNINVLLLEAGGMEYPAAVDDAARWTESISGPQDWSITTRPARGLGGRSLQMPMGRMAGGSTSIGAMIWARGHKSDWDRVAEATGDAEWGYPAVLKVYDRIENHHGLTDIGRGKGGPVDVYQSPDNDELSSALLDAASKIGVPRFLNPNGLMMEAANGCALSETTAQAGKRITIFGSYLQKALHRQNLTILANTPARRVLIEGGQAVGVEAMFNGEIVRFSAMTQVILSAGALNTPRILLQSGIGDMRELKRVGIRLTAHLPGVGKNLQDHLYVPTLYNRGSLTAPAGNGIGATMYISANSHAGGPDIEITNSTMPLVSPGVRHSEHELQSASVLLTGLLRPRSRGSVSLTGSDDELDVHTNIFSQLEDLRSARIAVRSTRELANQASLKVLLDASLSQPFRSDADLDSFIMQNAITLGHHVGTAKIGRDEMAVVDSKLRVYGIDNLMVADASIFPQVPTTGPMAACTVIGERAAELVRSRITGGDEPTYDNNDVETRFSW